MPGDIQQLLLATQIALLDKYYPSRDLEELVLKGLLRAKNVMVKANIEQGLNLYDLTSKELLSRTLSEPEWTAREEEDKNFSALGLDKASGLGITSTYAVPADKTLYISALSFAIHANDLATDGEKNQMGYAYLYNNTTSTTLALTGGNGGGAVILNKPQVVPGSETLIGYLVNRSAHSCNLYLTYWGYEI